MPRGKTSSAAEWARAQTRSVSTACVVCDTPKCKQAIAEIVAEVKAGRAKGVTIAGMTRYLRSTKGFKGAENSVRRHLAKHTEWYTNAA